MTVWVCRGCSAAYAVGLSRCPQCGSKDWDEEGRLEHMAKITATRGVSDRLAEEPAQEATESPEPADAEDTGVEAPAGDTEPETAGEPVELLERPADSDLKPAWVAYALQEGMDEAEANDPATTKAKLIELYG